MLSEKIGGFQVELGAVFAFLSFFLLSFLTFFLSISLSHTLPSVLPSFVLDDK